MKIDTWRTSVNIWGLEFKTPVGLSAGIDAEGTC